ncbi:MAG: CrcB family protein [Pseudomonadota bacterium]
MGVAGATGALTRYALSGLVQKAAGGAFPWGTLVVNLAGCWFFGVFWAAAESRVSLGGEVRAVVLVGFLGAFTTFSSYAFETSQLLRDSQWAAAAGNVALQNLAGISALFMGLFVGRLL